MAQASQHTLQFGTYTFPNQTFEIQEHKIDIDTPISDVRRTDQGQVLDGYLKPRRWRINGKVFGEDKGSVHNALITLQKAVHNDGVGASFYYKSDRYSFAQLAPGGVVANRTEGLYEFMWGVDIILVSKFPYVEEHIVNCVSGNRNNDSLVALVTPGGNFPTGAIFTFVAGTWGFSNQNIRVDNNANSLFFSYSGPILAGQTLVVDTCLGCVLLQDGLTMINAISHFGGHTFLKLEPGENSLVVNAPTLSFEICYQNKWYS